jgi:hypothetical protein
LLWINAYDHGSKQRNAKAEASIQRRHFFSRHGATMLSRTQPGAKALLFFKQQGIIPNAAME